MPVIVRLDKIMAERKISSNELAERIGTTPVNLSRIKKGHIRGIRFNTLEQLCLALRCQPGDLLEVMSEEDARKEFGLDWSGRGLGGANPIPPPPSCFRAPRAYRRGRRRHETGPSTTFDPDLPTMPRISRKNRRPSTCGFLFAITVWSGDAGQT